MRPIDVRLKSAGKFRGKRKDHVMIGVSRHQVSSGIYQVSKVSISGVKFICLRYQYQVSRCLSQVHQAQTPGTKASNRHYSSHTLHTIFLYSHIIH